MITVTNIRNSKKDLSNIAKIIAVDIRKRSLIPYFGAGLSNDPPSNNLLALDIRAPLITLLVEALTKSVPIESIGLSAQDLKVRFEEYTPERIIDSFYDLQAQEVYKYLSILNVSKPNDNHRMLARLSARNLLPFCITLNFDTLFEQAAVVEGGNVISVVPLIESLLAYKEKPCNTLLIKPHGSFVKKASERAGTLSAIDQLLPALSQIGNSPHLKNIKVFGSAFETSKSVLVMGYGQRDWDVWPIVDIYKERIKRLYWVFYRDPGNTEAIAKKLPAWAKENRYECYAIIGDIDDLLYACLQYLGVEFDRYTGGCKKPRCPNTDMFCHQLRSAIAAINLMPERDANIKSKLFKDIVDQIQAKAHPDMMAISACYSQLAWSKYVRWDMKNAFRYNKQEIKCIAKSDNLSKHERRFRINRALLARGYIYLGKVKLYLKDVSLHSAQFSLRQSMGAFLYAVMGGLYYVRIWVMSCFMRDSYVVSYAGSQWNSLVHLILLRRASTSGQIGRLTAYLLRCVAKKYMDGVNCSSIIRTQAFFDREYFELRALEAELLARPSTSRLAEIERRVGDLHMVLIATKNGHIPEVYLCQALVIHRKTGDSMRARERLLDAERIWEAEKVFSGTQRVEEIAKCLGIDMADD